MLRTAYLERDGHMRQIKVYVVGAELLELFAELLFEVALPEVAAPGLKPEISGLKHPNNSFKS